jgi:hypothetical protein
MILSQDDFDYYVTETYPDVTDSMKSSHRLFEYCPYCKARMGLDVIRCEFICLYVQRLPTVPPEKKPDTDYPYICIFRCPDCKAERRWFLYNVRQRTYRITSIPGDSGAEIDELPADPPALRKAYSEALRALDANCPMATAAMIRRALQVITREILGAPRGNLADELKWLKGKPNKLGVTLSQDFHDNAYVIKEAANQAAHPDADPDLLTFTAEDAKDLNTIFLDLATELFVVPEAARRAKEEMIKRRKITSKLSVPPDR